MNFWTYAIAIPILFALSFQYIVSSPWHCQGMCCFVESTCTKIPITGHYDTKFKPAIELLQKSLTVGWELGLSMTVILNHDHENPVIDVAGGFRDKEKKQTYDRSTLNLVFSNGKLFESIAIAMLVDRGYLAFEDPIANYWPEYGQNGKEDITMKDILSHRSGTCFTFNETPSLETLQSAEKRDAFVASQTYLYPRGTVSYRGWSSAFISDGVCRRVDPQKRSLATFIQEELFDKVGEVFLSPPVLHSEHYEKISQVHGISFSTLLLGMLPQVFIPGIYSKILPDGHVLKIEPSASTMLKALVSKSKHQDGFSCFDQPNLPDVMDGKVEAYNDHSSFLSYNMMSGNSISNARALAKAFDLYMRDDGHLVQHETFAAFNEPFPTAFDRSLEVNLTHAAGGWAISPNVILPIEGATCYGWFGIGGSLTQHCVVGDQKVTISYVMNAMTPLFDAERAVRVLKKVVEIVSQNTDVQ
jgi:CubicO group peptidase (beta-lactamase class C family)